MASATTQHRRAILQLAVLLLATPAAMLAAAAGVCESEKFPAGRSYATCSDLPSLGATLHWTYDAAASSLSLAFVAKPSGGASGAGWVAWGINPTGDGMKGTQALVAFKGASGAYAINTYNVTGYRPLGAASTPIAFKATGLAADESGGKVRLYGKLQLSQGMETVNHIWQVGSAVTGGEPAKHAFAKENLEAKGKLVLAGGGAQEPAPAPVAGGPSVEVAGNVETQTSSPAPSGGKKASASATTCASAPVLIVLLACVGFLAIV